MSFTEFAPPIDRADPLHPGVDVDDDCPSSRRCYVCCRPVGHAMPHRALGVLDEICAEWDDEEET